MAFNFTISFGMDEWDQLLSQYDVDSSSELRDEVRDDMKNHVLEKAGIEVDN